MLKPLCYKSKPVAGSVPVRLRRALSHASPIDAFLCHARHARKEFDAACARLDSVQFASALWNRKLEVWSADPAIRQLVANRLGWLRVTRLRGRLSFRDCTRSPSPSRKADSPTSSCSAWVARASLPKYCVRCSAPPIGRRDFACSIPWIPMPFAQPWLVHGDTLFVMASKSGIDDRAERHG